MWGDWHRPAQGTLARIPDPRAAQFWDPDHLVSEELKRVIQSSGRLLQSKCCIESGFYWDMAAIFPRDAPASAALPQPAFFDGAVIGQAAAIERELKEFGAARQP